MHTQQKMNVYELEEGVKALKNKKIKINQEKLKNV